MLANRTIDFDDELSDAVVDELGDLFEIWTPGEIKAYLELLSNHVQSLDSQIARDAACFKDADLEAWSDFKVRWVQFVRDTGWFARVWMGSLRAAERFAEELREYATLYSKRCGKNIVIGEIPIPSEAHEKEVASFFGGIKSLGGTVVTVALVGAGVYILTKWAGKKWR